MKFSSALINTFDLIGSQGAVDSSPLNGADAANVQAFTAALASGEYVQIRNALIVLNKLVKVGSVILELV